MIFQFLALSFLQARVVSSTQIQVFTSHMLICLYMHVPIKYIYTLMYIYLCTHILYIYTYIIYIYVCVCCIILSMEKDPAPVVTISTSAGQKKLISGSRETPSLTCWVTCFSIFVSRERCFFSGARHNSSHTTQLHKTSQTAKKRVMTLGHWTT